MWTRVGYYLVSFRAVIEPANTKQSYYMNQFWLLLTLCQCCNSYALVNEPSNTKNTYIMWTHVGYYLVSFRAVIEPANTKQSYYMNTFWLLLTLCQCCNSYALVNGPANTKKHIYSMNIILSVSFHVVKGALYRTDLQARRHKTKYSKAWTLPLSFSPCHDKYTLTKWSANTKRKRDIYHMDACWILLSFF